MKGKKYRVLLMMLVISALFIVSMPAMSSGETYIIPIEGDIDNGNWLFIQRAYNEALDNGATAIIFEIDTYGGYIDSAMKIADLILACPLPTYCYVSNKALSAGSLIALAGEKLIMAPGATIGAAEPRLFNQTADPKTLSMWSTKLSSIAQTRGRDGEIAAAFADVEMEIEGLTEQGQLLTLSSIRALELGIADSICYNRFDLIEEYELSATAIKPGKSFQEKAGGLLSDPLISMLLLALGIAGIVIEIATAGSFGVFGTVGLLSFALFFIGRFWAGNITVGAVLLFFVGLILIVLEIFIIPGFGVTGILGVIAVFASLLMASTNFSHALLTLGGSLLIAIILIIITLRNKTTRKIWSKLILSSKLDTESGYVSHDESRLAYLGKSGITLTIVRPAGTADIEGKRVDVVTNGEFIEAGKRVEVILVEGTRVVVREELRVES